MADAPRPHGPLFFALRSERELDFLYALVRSPLDPVLRAGYADWLLGENRAVEAELHRRRWVQYGTLEGHWADRRPCELRAERGPGLPWPHAAGTEVYGLVARRVIGAAVETFGWVFVPGGTLHWVPAVDGTGDVGLGVASHGWHWPLADAAGGIL